MDTKWFFLPVLVYLQLANGSRDYSGVLQSQFLDVHGAIATEEKLSKGKYDDNNIRQFPARTDNYLRHEYQELFIFSIHFVLLWFIGGPEGLVRKNDSERRRSCIALEEGHASIGTGLPKQPRSHF